MTMTMMMMMMMMMTSKVLPSTGGTPWNFWFQVTNKPIKTVQQEFPVPKFRPRDNVVYKISCASCPWNYIHETKRSFNTRRKEHIRNTKQCAKSSNVAKHAWTFKRL